MQFQSEQKNLNAAGLPGPTGNACQWLESQSALQSRCFFSRTRSDRSAVSSALGIGMADGKAG